MGGVTDDQVRAAAAALTGDLDQVPPMVSAIHVGGRRLHELAREGVEVDRAPRRVHVASFEVAPLQAGTWRFEVTCSSGTYVRSLADDLGRALGGGAHLASLRRTRVGRFGLDVAVGLDELRERGADGAALLAPPRAMVEHLGIVAVGRDDAATLARGGRVRVDGVAAGEVAVCDDNGELVCVAASDGAVLRPEVVLAGSGPTDGG